MDPNLNMAVISVPGKFAAGVAQECLDKRRGSPRSAWIRTST